MWPSIVTHVTWVVIWSGVNYVTRGYTGFYRPISGYIPLCYFRHVYFELGLSLVVFLRNSMGVVVCVWFGRTFLGHLDD